jgi:single-strand DNA-binding protein
VNYDTKETDMYQQTIILGYTGADIELRSTSNGTSVANFSVATSEKWRDKSGEKKEETMWHKVVAWDRLAENAAQYVGKGSLILVVGKLQRKTWEKDGAKHSSVELVARSIQYIDTKPPADSDGGSPDSGSSDSGSNSSANRTSRVPF